MAAKYVPRIVFIDCIQAQQEKGGQSLYIFRVIPGCMNNGLQKMLPDSQNLF
jgi:hypothetical protein